MFSEEAYHTFDGDGMIHAIEFRDGKARYRNRFIENEGFKLEQERGDWVYKGMNSLMDPTLKDSRGRPSSKNWQIRPSRSTKHAVRAPRASQPTVISLPDLETKGPTDFGGK